MIAIILHILFILLTTLFIIQILLKLSGHSPTEMQVLYGGLVTLAISLIIGSYKLIYRLGRIDQHLLDIDRRLVHIEKRLN